MLASSYSKWEQPSETLRELVQALDLSTIIKVPSLVCSRLTRGSSLQLVTHSSTRAVRSWMRIQHRIRHCQMLTNPISTQGALLQQPLITSNQTSKVVEASCKWTPTSRAMPTLSSRSPMTRTSILLRHHLSRRWTSCRSIRRSQAR